jgi:CRP/FNR family cyclic AMP-dependent transcriptional regulator
LGIATLFARCEQQQLIGGLNRHDRLTKIIPPSVKEKATVNSFNPNYFLHVANVLLLVAYSVRDILWLRLFAVASALIAIPYFVLQPAPLWVPIGWSSVFAAINLFQSWRLFIERRPVKLTPEEEEARRLAFEDLPPRKVLQVLSVGSWITAKSGERMIERGRSTQVISLIVRGTVRVARNEVVLGDLVAGHLVGSALLLTGTPGDVDAVAIEPVRALRWEVATLERYLNANPDVRIVMQRHLARDLGGKLISYLRDGGGPLPKYKKM